MVAGKFDPGESSVVMELTQAMHAFMKDFVEMDLLRISTWANST